MPCLVIRTIMVQGQPPETSPAADPRAPGQLAFDGLPIDGFMSVAEEEFVLLRLHEPFALHGVEYPRSFVWAYRHCTQLERGLVMPADAVLPLEVQLSLAADDRQFLGEVFSESTYCQVFSLPSSDDEAWGELDSDDAREGAVDSGDDDALPSHSFRAHVVMVFCWHFPYLILPFLTIVGFSFSFGFLFACRMAFLMTWVGFRHDIYDWLYRGYLWLYGSILQRVISL